MNASMIHRESNLAALDAESIERLPVTVIVAVRNEAKNIRECLLSVSRMDQVFVVDSASTDETCEIAESLGATVVQFAYDGGWPKKRNWALQQLPIRNAWVLILDGDERVDDELFQQIRAAIQREDVNGYYLRWKFIFLGRWMKHCWRHGWMLRLFRHGTAEYEDLGLRSEGGWDAEVHENIVLREGLAERLSAWLVHDTSEDLTYWIRKQNEFSLWNAVRRSKQLADGLPSLRGLFSSDPVKKRKALKALFLRLPCKPTLMFLWLYVFRLGILDGREGYVFCRLRAIHEFNIGAKVFERRLSSSRGES
jgi:glycosyltransferase involved in cell wall biosynthesis